MLKEKAGSVELLQHANKEYLEHRHCEIVRAVYQTIRVSGLGKFTFSWIDSLWKDLNTTVRHVERLPDATFSDLMEVIEGLTEARNELRHARFLFDVEEIKPTYRLIMRNRAVLRGKYILEKVLLAWPHR